ncbi:MAG TPA: GNAT family N-acetyltransferase [Burkholderiaceae bacterium]|nr:GNAT family N-acetyltransferase [Burkholderiaceae bacterium]
MFDPTGLQVNLVRREDALAARVEDAGLTSSQPPQQTIYDGWLLRYSPGKAKRARSVNAVGAGRLPLDEKIAHVDAFYSSHGLPSLYRITPFTEPPALDRALQDAGYAAFDESRVMTAELSPAVHPSDPRRPLRQLGASEFAGIAGELRGSGAATVAAERQRIAGIALPSHFLVADDGDRAVACGSIVIDGGFAGIFNMVTAEQLRGRGYASAIVSELLRLAAQAGARLAYLQVDAANAAARRVYARFGFADRYAYWYRMQQRDGRAAE